MSGRPIKGWSKNSGASNHRARLNPSGKRVPGATRLVSKGCYRFESHFMIEQLDRATEAAIADFQFAVKAFEALQRESRVISFEVTVVEGNRSRVALQSLVDWALWLAKETAFNQHNSTTLKTPDDCEKSFSELIALFEYWPETEPQTFYQRYIAGEDCPSLRHAAYHATPGNLMAALGLAKLDRALLHAQKNQPRMALLRLSDAWECHRVAQLLNWFLIFPFLREQHQSAVASE